MCLDGRAAAWLVAAASMVAGVADKPGQQAAGAALSAAPLAAAVLDLRLTPAAVVRNPAR
jgi:hypothetical protein